VKENPYHAGIIQELPTMTRVRPAHHTVALIDTCCARFRPVFHNVRHFEQFTQLLLSLVAETKRKSLPRLAKSVQGEAQALRQEMQRRYRYFLYWVFGFPALTIGVVALLMLTIFPQ
jgi:hypothetical protein